MFENNFIKYNPLNVLLIFGILVGLESDIFAQPFDLGLNPPSMSWNQINTDKVQVIFPTPLEVQAQRVANLIHYLYDNSIASIGDQSDKVTIILQNQTTTSNGFVSTFPFRSEFFTTPPQFAFSGTANWMDLLTIHEYRHVQQFQNSKRGITKLVAKVFGNDAWGTFSRLAMPRWYFEGDAINAETALTPSGRGRMPDFTREYRALILNQSNFNYEKATGGSFKDFVPDHWHLGYFMTGHTRIKYGQEIWKSSLDDATRYRGLVYPLNNSLKKQTGKGTKELYGEMMRDLKENWEQEETTLQFTSSKLINTKLKKKFTNYRSPHHLQSGQVLVEKSGLDLIRTFYMIDKNGNEKRLTPRGFNGGPNPTLSVTENLIVWSEQEFDERWGNQDYAIIKSYDINTGLKKKLTSKTKYFSPDISHDSNSIVAVEVTENQEYSLHIIDVNTGRLKTKLPNPQNYFFRFPRWTDDDQKLVVVAQKEQANALISIDLSTNDLELLVDFNQYLITSPYSSGEWTFFSASFSGIDNIYAVKFGEADIYQVTSTLLGAYQPSVSRDGKKLLYSEYSVNGFDIKEIELNPSQWTKIDPSQFFEYAYGKSWVEFEQGNILDKIPDQKFEINKFRQSSGLIFFHSLDPSIFHPSYGFDLITGNKFSTMEGSIGYRYNTNEKFHQIRGNLTYGGLYPVFELEGVSINDRDRLQPDVRIVNDTTVSLFVPARQWDESDVSLGVTFPFNLSHDNYFSSLQFESKYHLLYANYETFEDSQADGFFNAIDLRMRFNHARRKARQHINSRFAQFLDVMYKTTIGNDENEGTMFQVTTTLLFPGAFRSHSSWISHSYRKEGFTDSYKFVDNFSYARGYPSVPHDKINRFSVNYSIPIWYPDLAAGPVAFFQRVKTNFFFDFSEASLDPILVSDFITDPNLNPNAQFEFLNRRYKSVGVELTFDFRFFRIVDLDLGVRWSYLLDQENVSGFNQNQFEFIFFGIGF